MAKLTPEEKLDILKRGANDLLEFGKAIAPKLFYLPSPQFHKEVAELLMDRSITQLCIQAPRGFSKSTLTTLFILHHILYDSGDKSIVIQSKTLPEAINRLTMIKNFLEYSTRFKNLYDYWGKESDGCSTWRENKIKTIVDGRSVTIRAVGTLMPTRGSLESSIFVDNEEGEVDVDASRISLYFLDDPDDEDSCVTKEQMKKNYDKFGGTKEGLDKRNGRVIVLGTPIRQGCIVDVIFSSPIGWKTKVYKAEWTENGTKQLLWEEMRDAEWLKNKKEALKQEFGTYRKYYSEFLCEITGEDDRTFAGWKYWDGELIEENGFSFIKLTHINQQQLPIPEKIPVNIFIGIDPASSTKQSADYSVTFVIAYSNDKKIYVLPYYRERCLPTTHAEQIIQTIKEFKPTKAFVESVGYQEFLRQYLRQRLEEEDLYVSGLETKFQPKTEKSARLETMQPFFANGKVYVKEDMYELINELELYPNGKHDDLLDGLYYATRRLIPPDHMAKIETPIYFLPRRSDKLLANERWMV